VKEDRAGDTAYITRNIPHTHKVNKDAKREGALVLNSLKM